MQLGRNPLGMISIFVTILFSPMTYPGLISIVATEPFPSSVPVSSTSTATFAVTNTTLKTPLTVIDQSQFPAKSGLSITANTCGALLQAGQSCAITLQLLAPAIPKVIHAELKEWAKPSAYALKFPFTLNVTNAAPLANEVLIAVGEDSTNSLPLLAVSRDKGQTWTNRKAALSTHSALFSGSCTGVGSTAICATGGQNDIDLSAVLAVSRNGGLTWAVPTIPVAKGVVFGTDCTGSETTAVCIAVGKNQDSSLLGEALVTVSTDGGVNWFLASLDSVPIPSALSGASCTGEGSASICTAAGYSRTSGVASPVLVESANGGNTWNIPSVSGSFSIGYLSSTSCTGNTGTAVCVAVGTGNASFSYGPPILAVTTNGGITWSTKTISGFSDNVRMSHVSCTGTAATAVCATVGGTQSGSPMLAVSTNGGNTWNVPTIPDFPSLGWIDEVSCTGDGSTAICVAGGFDYDVNLPLLVVSTDGGNTWAIKHVDVSPIEAGGFGAVSCTGSESTAVCIAAGTGFIGSSDRIPLMIVSVDGANTWALKDMSSVSTVGEFYSSGASGGAESLLSKSFIK